jgi:hypothetical protein
MPYVLAQAANNMAIAECEWGNAGTIQFTRFTSCLGVLAKVAGANNVIGIHLVMVDGNGNTFSAADVPTVTAVLAAQGYDNTTCMIIGQIAYWTRSNGAAYTALLNALNNPQTYQFGDGVYGATIAAGAIEITY